eukprot:m.8006 g.8006  ORF g.8006 m.8006 type:complete len:441 (-) comp5351_c1_seq1:156-1478(-)
MASRPQVNPRAGANKDAADQMQQQREAHAHHAHQLQHLEHSHHQQLQHAHPLVTHMSHHPLHQHHPHHPHQHHQHDHEQAHHSVHHHPDYDKDTNDAVSLPSKMPKLIPAGNSAMDPPQMPITSQGLSIPMSPHPGMSLPATRLDAPPMIDARKTNDMMSASDSECPGIKQKGAKSAPCGDDDCLKCLQLNCCKRCPIPGCGHWSPIARRSCRVCNYQFTSKAKEMRRKHAGWTDQPKELVRAAAPASFDHTIQRKISAFFNARDGIFLGVSVYSGRSVVSRMYHNQTSFLAPSAANDGTMDEDSNFPQMATVDEMSTRTIEVTDPLLANNPVVMSCIRNLQQDVLRQVERLEEMLRDYVTVTATTGNRSRKCADKLVATYHAANPHVQQLTDPSHKPEHPQHQQHPQLTQHQQHPQHQQHQQLPQAHPHMQQHIQPHAL